MHLLGFPFWVVTQATHGEAVDEFSPARSAATFLSIKKAEDFMSATGGGHWEFALVVRAGFSATVKALRQRGFVGLNMNPKADGSGGTVIPFEDIETQQ